MRLVSRCPDCGTSFRVVADQLRIAQGWVRCGHCQTVYQAQDTLSTVQEEIGDAAIHSDEIPASSGLVATHGKERARNPVAKASAMEIAALELLLAEPANQEMIAQFGPPLTPLNTGTDVGSGIQARFGADLESTEEQWLALSAELEEVERA